MINNFDESALLFALIMIIHVINIFLCKSRYHYNFNNIFSLSVIQSLISLVLFFTIDTGQKLTWNIFYVNEILNLNVFINKFTVVFLNLINLLSLILLIFFEKYFHLFEKNNYQKTLLFFIYFFLNLNILIVCSNLVSSILIIVINGLLSIGYLNAKYHDHKPKVINTLSIIYFFQYILLFMLLIYLVELFNDNSFDNNNIIVSNLNISSQYILYTLSYFGLFLFTLVPFYYYIKLKIIDEFIVIIISQLFASLILFTKLIFYIFNFNFLPVFLKNDNLFINVFIIINLLVIASAMVYSKFKDNILTLLSLFSLSYLFLSYLILYKSNNNSLLFLSIGFIINISSLFITIMPFNLLQSKMNDQISFQGLFFLMPKSCILLILSLLNFIGIMPSFNMVANFQIFKIFANNMIITPLITIVVYNIIFLIFIAVFLKIILTRVSLDRSQEIINLSEKFENQQNLVYSRIVIIILSIIFFLFRKFITL